MLVEVFLAGEAFSSVALTGRVGAVDGVFGAAMFVVDFAFVAEEAAGVGEAREVFAAEDEATVGTLMFVHVFTVVMLASNGRMGWLDLLFTSTRISV